MKKPVIVLSLGDPAGIGPEVALKAISDPQIRRSADFVLAGLPSSLPKGKKVAGVGWLRPSSIPSWPRSRPSAASGRVAADSLRLAARLVMTGSAEALVTAPLSKEALHQAGEDFAGHTEMLADLAGLKADQVGMMLVGGGLRVFLATRHLGLKRALSSLEPLALKKSIRLCAGGLNSLFSIPKPRLALAALNPHAGEGGAFGDEEGRILRPVVRFFHKERKF
ncbi:MAG: 4-hydroxythreonine-4-phosphate dehydrogenase PdxA, partial [candidate division FCPU426 bacterium]